jgi:hypothetical protein
MVVLHPHVNTFIWSTNQDRFSQPPHFGHSGSLPSCKAHNQIHVGPPGCLSQRLASVTQCISAMASKLCACKFVHLPYQLNLWLHISFCPWSLLNPSPTFLSFGMFISLDLMLLLNMIESPLNLLSGNHFGERHVCMELRKNRMPSCLR